MLDDILNGLVTVLDWIQENIINGFAAWWFDIFKQIGVNYFEYQPIFEALNGLLGVFSA
ncbi:MAG: hypothetical protein LBB50_00295 [Oscillospiraceae bacterium]|nr:hypothetical protein [Oscillospiraceae bacterium]